MSCLFRALARLSIPAILDLPVEIVLASLRSPFERIFAWYFPDGAKTTPQADAGPLGRKAISSFANLSSRLLSWRQQYAHGPQSVLQSELLIEVGGS
jgi:hypothetical protein